MAEEGAAAAAAVPAEAAAPAAPVVEELTPTVALQRVLRSAMVADGLRRGLHECAKSLAKASKGADGAVAAGGARLCVLASDCDEASIVKLVKALCAEKSVPLMEVPAAKDLGEWCGLCKLDKEGKARKVVSTSVAVISDFGETSASLTYLQDHLRTIGAM